MFNFIFIYWGLFGLSNQQRLRMIEPGTQSIMDLYQCNLGPTVRSATNILTLPKTIFTYTPLQYLNIAQSVFINFSKVPHSYIVLFFHNFYIFNFFYIIFILTIKICQKYKLNKIIFPCKTYQFILRILNNNQNIL